MNKRGFCFGAILAAVVLAWGAVSAFGQYREYYFFGRVVDTDAKPVAGVEIRLRDVATSRGYTIKTNDRGEFKFAGLPHGVYSVTFKKEGYGVKEDEWRFPNPQDTMQKVEIPDVTLVSQELIDKAAKLKLDEARIQEAVEKIRNKDYDGAIASLQKFLEKNPDEVNALYFLGLSYARKKMFAEAVETLGRVAEKTPDFPPVFFELGLCYEQLDEPEKAIAAYQRNQELDPANADSAYNSGLILFRQGRVLEAQKAFEDALVIKPDDPEILEMVSRCYINGGDFVKAVEYLEKAKAKTTDPDKIKFIDDLIQTLKEKIKGGC